MSYKIAKYGEYLTIYDNKSDDKSTSLSIPGKHKRIFSEELHKDLVNILQNFADSIPPYKPIIGQIWYDSKSNYIKVYDDKSRWVPANMTTAVNVGNKWGDAFGIVIPPEKYDSDGLFITQGAPIFPLLLQNRNNVGGVELRFKTLKAGPNIELKEIGCDSILINTPAINNAGENVGSGRHIYKTATDDGTLIFRTLQAGPNVNILSSNNTVDITVLGESNAGINVGCGEFKIFDRMDGENLLIRGFRAGKNIKIGINECGSIEILTTAELNTGKNIGGPAGNDTENDDYGSSGFNTETLAPTIFWDYPPGWNATTCSDQRGFGLYRGKFYEKFKFASIRPDGLARFKQMCDAETIEISSSASISRALNIGCGEGRLVIEQKDPVRKCPPGYTLQYDGWCAGFQVLNTIAVSDYNYTVPVTYNGWVSQLAAHAVWPSDDNTNPKIVLNKWLTVLYLINLTTPGNYRFEGSAASRIQVYINGNKTKIIDITDPHFWKYTYKHLDVSMDNSSIYIIVKVLKSSSNIPPSGTNPTFADYPSGFALLIYDPDNNLIFDTRSQETGVPIKAWCPPTFSYRDIDENGEPCSDCINVDTMLPSIDYDTNLIIRNIIVDPYLRAEEDCDSLRLHTNYPPIHLHDISCAGNVSKPNSILMWLGCWTDVIIPCVPLCTKYTCPDCQGKHVTPIPFPVQPITGQFNAVGYAWGSSYPIDPDVWPDYWWQGGFMQTNVTGGGFHTDPTTGGYADNLLDPTGGGGWKKPVNQIGCVSQSGILPHCYDEEGNETDCVSPKWSFIGANPNSWIYTSWIIVQSPPSLTTFLCLDFTDPATANAVIDFQTASPSGEKSELIRFNNDDIPQNYTENGSTITSSSKIIITDRTNIRFKIFTPSDYDTTLTIKLIWSESPDCNLQICEPPTIVIKTKKLDPIDPPIPPPTPVPPTPDHPDPPTPRPPNNTPPCLTFTDLKDAPLNQDQISDTFNIKLSQSTEILIDGGAMSPDVVVQMKINDGHWVNLDATIPRTVIDGDTIQFKTLSNTQYSTENIIQLIWRWQDQENPPGINDPIWKTGVICKPRWSITTLDPEKEPEYDPSTILCWGNIHSALVRNSRGVDYIMLKPTYITVIMIPDPNVNIGSDYAVFVSGQYDGNDNINHKLYWQTMPVSNKEFSIICHGLDDNDNWSFLFPMWTMFTALG